MMKVNFTLTVVLLFLLNVNCERAFSQNGFFDVETIQKIEIHFSQPNWDFQLDTAKHGSDDYVMADWAKINGIQFNDVGVKYKGNSSYDSTYKKNPIHIELNHVHSQSYMGITDIKLSNGYADPSVIREVLAYDVLKNYMDCPRSNFAQLYINDDYIGLFSNDESIDKKFVSRNFNSSSGTFFKCNPVVTPGPTTKSNLRYIAGGDSTSYFNFYELKSDYGWDELIRLCDTVTNYPSSVESVLDMDRVMWMLAFNTVLVNLDSYTGVFCQNYYLYRDKTKRFNPVIWDLNMAFGGFPFVGSGGTSMASLTIANMKQLSPTFHATDPYWPLINDVMGNASLKKQFIAHAKTINDENFVSGNYLSRAMQLQSVIDTAVLSDPNGFFTYNQFQNGLTTDYPFSSYQVPGIMNLMDARAAYLQTVPEFQLVPPTINFVNVSNSSPDPDEVVTISALVQNAGAVYMGYRNSLSGKFARIMMFDDGLHNDGTAGDGIYGIDVTVDAPFIQYYIYAENNDAAVFSPRRAEHEFYSLKANLALPEAGDVVINEFVAMNLNGTVNDYGVRADWIELYNNTSSPVSLYGTYLTDDFDRPAKFAFPKNTIIPANGFLTIWADEESSSTGNIHCNFKLAEGGEELMLSNGFAYVIDSLTYGTQLDDVSFGRCPDGTGNFQFIGNPSFNSTNCIPYTSDTPGWGTVKFFPNPTTGQFMIGINDDPSLDEIRILNFIGQTVRVISPVDSKRIDIGHLAAGVYTVELINHTPGLRVQKKQVKLNQK